ncbi:hypothetical protein HGM15179_008182 [Zosterops borbonicus]|uniref:Uncharacterized protein n=1 Tax=Zosterops borbonicus TaxID=364589 RepID=A0A8K1GJZ3_9PASS|nr:hypothetical protein HGM15179_008182 [Zosterops borbonicus]
MRCGALALLCALSLCPAALAAPEPGSGLDTAPGNPLEEQDGEWGQLSWAGLDSLPLGLGLAQEPGQ